MKIIELLEAIVKPKIELPKQFRGTLKDNRFNGIEAFSKVRDKRNDPHLIQKYSHTPMTSEWEEGFMLFTKYIVKHDLMDNIFFPKIYKVGQIKDANGKHIDKYDIERLEQTTSLSHDEFVAIYDKIFNNPPKVYNERVLASQLHNAIEHFDGSNIKDPELLTALEAINKLANEVKRKYLKLHVTVNVDIHSDNIMIRRTPYGPQLVINDPLAVLRNRSRYF